MSSSCVAPKLNKITYTTKMCSINEGVMIKSELKELHFDTFGLRT